MSKESRPESASTLGGYGAFAIKGGFAARDSRLIARIRQNQDLLDWRDFQDFASPRFALFVHKRNPANPNVDKRFSVEISRLGEILKIL